MKVSVVCPTHDRPVQLRCALASVLAQTHGNLELIVVADGATERTLATLEALRQDDSRVRVLEVRHHGHPAPLRDLALARADGDAIAYIDDDDEWFPDHLATLLDACDECHPVVVSGAEYRTADGALLRRVAGPELAWHPEIAAADPYTEPSRLLHLRGVPERVGGWRDLGVGLEDWDLWWRLAEAGVPFLPVARATVRLAVAETTRRHAVRCDYFVPVCESTDEASARALAAAMRAPSERLRAATSADLDAWAEDLLADELTVWPLGVPEPLRHVWATVVAHTGTGCADLVPASLRGRWHVAVPLWCAEPAHARIAERVLRHRQPRQLQVLRELAVERCDLSHSTNEGTCA
jgi:Glycosyl transferase family 2